ncbi:PleD family two-component system response regulator [Chloroflexota bacterium]
MDGRSRILIVDDDPVFAETIATILESRNYQVSTAYDGDEGLQKVKDEKPDMVLLDIIMPTQDGFHVCEEIKKDPQLADIPVIMLTSFAQKRGETNIPVSAGLGLEAEGYIDKPVSPEELLKKVGDLLKK